MDKVNGSCMENMDPCPTFESMDTDPPNDSIVFLTTSRPTPRPETSEILSAVENPEAKISSYACLSVSAEAVCSVMMPFFNAFSITLSLFMPAPSSSISMKT